MDRRLLARNDDLGQRSVDLNDLGLCATSKVVIEALPEAEAAYAARIAGMALVGAAVPGCTPGYYNGEGGGGSGGGGGGGGGTARKEMSAGEQWLAARSLRGQLIGEVVQNQCCFSVM